MAAEKNKTAKPRPPKPPKQGKGMRGKMPVKRSINLTLDDENKINPVQAVLGIVAILLLTAVFSKFLVYDRIASVSAASNRAAQARKNLETIQEELKNFGDVEDTYAHYTQDGMTAAELSLVDRTRVLSLVRTLLSEGNATFGPADFRERLSASSGAWAGLDDEDFDPAALRETLIALASSNRDETTVRNWSVSGNVLTVEIAGGSLEKLNLVARRLETNDIVDSCVISTANKQGQSTGRDVIAKLIVYLVQPPKGGSAS